jgi:adenylosuccinate synthase
MSVTAVVGTQWGDEGKGRMVDLLAADADAVVRFQGGANAGHTIVTHAGKFVFNLLPSGILSPKTVNILGAGVVIDLEALNKEIAEITKRVPERGRLVVCERAHIVLPLHKRLEALLDKQPSLLHYDSTRRGIAQAYQFKAAKMSIQAGDLLGRETWLRDRLAPIVEFANIMFRGMGASETSVDEVFDDLTPHIESLRPYITNTLPLTSDLIKRNANIIVEGQLGTLRDLDWGIYPYTTSSNPIAGYAAVGAGIPVGAFTNVLGIAKAYSSCVGAGPFVTEISGATAALIRETGHEYGAATGRPRRVGWFDAVATRHGAAVQGANSLCVTLIDVLSCLDTISVCTRYRTSEGEMECFPINRQLVDAAPILKEFPGWSCDISDARTIDDLPAKTRHYLDWIEESVGVAISHISVGPRRDQIIYV